MQECVRYQRLKHFDIRHVSGGPNRVRRPHPRLARLLTRACYRAPWHPARLSNLTPQVIPFLRGNVDHHLPWSSTGIWLTIRIQIPTISTILSVIADRKNCLLFDMHLPIHLSLKIHLRYSLLEETWPQRDQFIRLCFRSSPWGNRYRLPSLVLPVSFPSKPRPPSPTTPEIRLLASSLQPVSLAL